MQVIIDFKTSTIQFSKHIEGTLSTSCLKTRIDLPADASEQTIENLNQTKNNIKKC